jgi:hypothetical protein
MKLLLIYIGHEKKFSPEHEELTKIQIDNSLDLGWKKKDILLVTNFPYTYKGINSYVIEGDYDALDGNRSSKILAINQLFRKGKIGEDIYWFHDHDAFQLIPMRDPDTTGIDLAYTDQGWDSTWNAGSFFFKKEAMDIFTWIEGTMAYLRLNEQDSLTYLINGDVNFINRRLKKLNTTYNLGIYHIDDCMKKADQPLIVAHFHPHKSRHMNLFRNIVPERLMKIFNLYGIV